MKNYAIIIELDKILEMKFEVQALNILNATKEAIAFKELNNESRFLEITKLEITSV